MITSRLRRVTALPALALLALAAGCQGADAGEQGTTHATRAAPMSADGVTAAAVQVVRAVEENRLAADAARVAAEAMADRVTAEAEAARATAEAEAARVAAEAATTVQRPATGAGGRASSDVSRPALDSVPPAPKPVPAPAPAPKPAPVAEVSSWVHVTNVDCRTDGVTYDVSLTVVWSDGHTWRGHGYTQPLIYNLYVDYAGRDVWNVAPEDQELCY